MIDLSTPLTFRSGAVMRNRLMLAPMTNSQSNADGTLSEDELRWLTMRARGGFGATMTCASHVQRTGQGFPGQLGIWSDLHLPGLSRLAAAIRAESSLALVQLHHAGPRSPSELTGEQPAGPSAADGVRAMATAEVEALRDDFVAAAVRAEQAGFDGVELHGAHSYVLCAFLSAEQNHREDRYGGSPENRARLLHEVIEGIRSNTGAGFTLGVRLSPERFGLDTAEMIELARGLLTDGRIDFLDMSLWDAFAEPTDERFAGRRLVDWFAELPRRGCVLGVAGKVHGARQARACLEAGADVAIVGRAAILHHDWPLRAVADPDFEPASLPVSAASLAGEGISPAFMTYLAGPMRIVAPEDPAGVEPPSSPRRA